MTYVGATPTTGDFKVLDSITTSSSTTFNLRQGGVAVYPQSANHCLVVLNGVLQTAGSSFNIVNDTIVFASSLASSDVINQILVLGNVNNIGVPSDDTVSTAKLQSSAVTDAKISAMASSKLTGVVPTANLGSGTASSSTVLYGDQTFKTAPSGGLTFIKREVLGSNGDFDIDNLFTTDFANYLVVLEDFTATVDSASLRMRMHDTSGIVTGGKYRYACRYFDDDGNVASNTGVDQTQFQISDDSEEDAAWLGYNATFTFYKPRQNTTTRFTGHGSFIDNDKASVIASYNAGHIDDEQEMRGLFFYYSSGGIRAGATIISYGFNES